MFARIIVGIDGTKRGRDALALGRLIARSTGASVLLASVYPRAPLRDRLGEAHERAARGEAEKRIAEAAELLSGVGEVEHRAVSDTSPARGLQHLAEKEAADLIVVGSSHRGAVGRVMPGSVGERLLHGAPCAVAVAPVDFWSDPDPRPRVIGVGYDGGTAADAALKVAAELAKGESAALRIVTVVDSSGLTGLSIAGGAGYGEVMGPLREQTRQMLDDAVESVPAETRPEGRLCQGEAADELVRQSETLDLLVTGSRGYGMIGRALLGGVSSQVIREAACPVLIVPGAAEPGESGG